MRWPAAMVLAAACAVGCHSAPPVFDPFLPRTRIPPPGTGAANGAPDANYISPAPPYTGSAPAYTPSPATGAPSAGGANGPYAPPGGFQYQQSAPTGGGFGATPGPVNSSQILPASRRPAANRGVVLALQNGGTDAVSTAIAVDDGQAASQNRSLSGPTQPRSQSGQVLRASYVTTADVEPSTVYERRRPGQTSMAASDDDSSSQAIDIMDLPPVAASRR
jgi:hypothetical protein